MMPTPSMVSQPWALTLVLESRSATKEKKNAVSAASPQTSASLIPTRSRQQVIWKMDCLLVMKVTRAGLRKTKAVGKCRGRCQSVMRDS